MSYHRSGNSSYPSPSTLKGLAEAELVLETAEVSENARKRAFAFIQCIQKFFSQTLFDFKRMVSHSISPKLSGKIPYVLSKPRICFLGSKDKAVLC